MATRKCGPAPRKVATTDLIGTGFCLRYRRMGLALILELSSRNSCPTLPIAMTTRADVNMSFYMRFVLIGTVAVCYGLWALYDGFVGYPAQRERALKYEELAKQDNFETAWVDHARSQGWSLENPGEPKTQADIYFNYALAAICLPLGLWMLTGVVRARGRWIEADETSIRSSWGQHLVFDQIRQLDKRKWKNKGIARVHYEQDGRKRKFVIDDFKFRREPTGEILRKVEAAIGPNKITGGPPEA